MASEEDNLSFVLNAIQDVSFQQRPIPKARKLLRNASLAFHSPHLSRRSRDFGPSEEDRSVACYLGDLAIDPV